MLPFLSHARTLASPNPQFQSQSQLTLAIVLTMRDRAGLDAYIAALHDRNSSNYHRWLTPVEIANKFGSSQGDYDAVVAWLQGQGIKVTQTFNHRLVIMASTTADVASRVFGVSFGTYNYNNQTFIAAANEPSVPAQFSGIVSSVIGLDTYYGLVSNLAHRVTPVQQAGSNSLSPPYTPANIRTAYSLPALSANGVAMGILSGCEASTTDLNGFASTYSLPSYTLNTNYFRIAVNSKGDGSDPLTTQEATLDLEWSHALGPGANLYFYFDNNVSSCGSTSASWTFSGMIAATAKALADNLVQTWSISWGCSEDACWNSAYRNDMDKELASMVAAGMTGFVATGDEGAYATGDKSTLDVQFPGSDPNIVAVGGTTLTINNDGSYGSESALWCPTCETYGWGGGGGNSVIFPKPSWQSAVVSGTGRGIPDVSLDMDFHYPIYYGGAISNYWGGTSFAAPEWNGIMTTIIYATTQPTSRFGNINYDIYPSTSLWTKRDVRTGANGYTSSCGGSGQPQCGYGAGLGWDYATGWGSLDGILVELTTNVASGSGSVSPSCPSGCSEDVGSSISVSAIPSTNWQFSTWAVSGASCSGGASSNPCAFSMPDNAVTVSATFTQTTVTQTTTATTTSTSSTLTSSTSTSGTTTTTSVTSTSTTTAGEVCITTTTGIAATTVNEPGATSTSFTTSNTATTTTTTSTSATTTYATSTSTYTTVTTTTTSVCTLSSTSTTVSTSTSSIPLVSVGQISSVVSAGVGSDWFVLPDYTAGQGSMTHTSAGKCGGVRVALATDVYAGTYMFGSLTNPQQNEILDTNSAYVSQSSSSCGQPSTAAINPSQPLVTIAGPAVNEVVYYYESVEKSSPLYYNFANGCITRRDTGVGVSCNFPSTPTSDVFVMEAFTDQAGRTVYIIYGLNWPGTLAGYEVLVNFVLRNTSGYSKSWYVYKWTDATSGVSANSIPDPGDTYTQIASGP